MFGTFYFNRFIQSQIFTKCEVIVGKYLQPTIFTLIMVKAYNFLAAWQLFPEKCNFNFGIAPKSGNYTIESINSNQSLNIGINWVSVENEAFYSQYTIVPDGLEYPFENKDLADTTISEIISSSEMKTTFYKSNEIVLSIQKEILSNGYLKLVQNGFDKNKKPYTNTEIYHKQMNVLPYASSLTGVAIRPTSEGVIKHKALNAMEEQTNMQLSQIREQIELLARQAQEIHKRKELSLMIYDAKITFKPQIGQRYHLYQKKNNTYVLSLVAPEEWGGSGPFKEFVSSVQLLGDHTWKEV